MADPSRFNAPRFNVFAQEFVPGGPPAPGGGFTAPPGGIPAQAMYSQPGMIPHPMYMQPGQQFFQPSQQIPIQAFRQPMPNYAPRPVVIPQQMPQMPQSQPVPAQQQQQATPPKPVAPPAPASAVSTVAEKPAAPKAVPAEPKPAEKPVEKPAEKLVSVEKAAAQLEKVQISTNGANSKPISAVEETKKEEEWEITGDDATESSEAVMPKPKPIVESKAPKKDHCNIIFCGHVDAGKSTIGGHIMYLCGLVDKRTLEKYEKEAKEMNRESWFYAWALDTNAEERDKGITVEVGRAHFETESKRYTILDAPGHKSFVPNMISGAAQADVAILVISARKGEFETGFERGGQTREHAMLVKTAGVKHLVVLINKMDETTVNWDEGRYTEIKKKLTPFLTSCGFKVKADGDVWFMPCSGFSGDYLKDCPPESTCPWYRGPSLLEYLDKLPGVGRQFDGPVRMPVVEKYRDMGTVVMGKLETGTVCIGSKLVVMPNKVPVEVISIMTEEDEQQNEIRAGENTKLKLKGIEEEDISTGFILCTPSSLCHTARIFDAQVAILDYKSIICPGWGAVMHAHTCTQEVQLRMIICMIDKKTGDKGEIKPKFMKQDQVAIARFEVLNTAVVCLETFKDFPQLGRFTLRDEGKTVAIGKVLKIVQ